MSTRKQLLCSRRSAQVRGPRARNANRAYWHAQAADRCPPQLDANHPGSPQSLPVIKGHVYRSEPGKPCAYASAPWLRKMGRACGFTSGRDSSAERRIRRMIVNAIQIETARLADLTSEDARV